MPIARFSGVIKGGRDPNRKIRAELLYKLFDAGWDIYNGNGDQVVTLGNIQKKIIESDAFIFTPGATLEDMFKAASIFVGFQTGDKDLEGKSAVIVNKDKSWNQFLALLSHLHKMGTVRENYDSILTVVNDPKQVLKVLKDDYKARKKKASKEPDIMENTEPEAHCSIVPPIENVKKPDFKVCVFCSASIKKQEYLDAGYSLGKILAENGWGCISGAGCTGIMGQVVKGAVENGGWTGGSNVPHIIALEGLPDGLAEFWPRGDIYTRMEIMIEKSDAFIAMPGGAGTIQEVLALVVLKEQGKDLMKDKPIVIVNKKDGDDFFWKPLLELLKKHNVSKMFKVARNHKEAIEIIKKSRNK